MILENNCQHTRKMTPSTFSTLLLILLGAALQATAHMVMTDPPPLRYKTNPYITVEDYDYSSPLSPSGSNYPCKGYLTDVGTPSGKSVATYAAGGSYTIRLAGSTTHLGGSCQISMSTNHGATFEVLKSYIGGCVKPDPSSDQSFGFTVPSNIPNGDVILAWTWFNEEGNREMYMNCAVVTIGGSRKSIRSDISPRASRPTIFLANIGNGCSTSSGTDVIFPNPGSDVTYGPSSKMAAPVGNCGASSGTTTTSGDTTTSSGSGSSTSSVTKTTTASSVTKTTTASSNHDCAYWRAQGYVCAAGVGLKEILPSAWWLLVFVSLQVFGLLL